MTLPVPGQRTLPSYDDTRALGRELAELVGPGDVIVLDGPLGAGKTALAAGIAEGLGVQGRVTSPTFVLARRHRPAAPGAPGMVHVDAYRILATDPEQPLQTHVLADELESLDLDSDLDTDVVVVEWGAGLADVLVDVPLVVTMSRAADSDERTAHWRWVPRYDDVA